MLRATWKCGTAGARSHEAYFVHRKRSLFWHRCVMSINGSCVAKCPTPASGIGARCHQDRWFWRNIQVSHCSTDDKHAGHNGTNKLSVDNGGRMWLAPLLLWHLHSNTVQIMNWSLPQHCLCVRQLQSRTVESTNCSMLAAQPPPNPTKSMLLLRLKKW